LRQATKRRSEDLPKSYFPKPGTDCERDDRGYGRSRAARRFSKAAFGAKRPFDAEAISLAVFGLTAIAAGHPAS
jgi:hypothetical protein